jgi:hypothetical protein
MFFVSFYHLKKENVPHCSVSKEKFFKNGKWYYKILNHLKSGPDLNGPTIWIPGANFCIQMIPVFGCLVFGCSLYTVIQ